MAADLLSIGYLLEADTLHTANAGRILIVLDPLDERSGTLLNPSIFLVSLTFRFGPIWRNVFRC